MKGSKHLSELVDAALFKVDKLNIIKAPTGSGKTYFALTHIPSLTYDAIHNVVYLIDTINGKEQILRNYNATSEYWNWARDIDEDGMWFSEDSRVVILTYAKFGVLTQRYTDFHKNFDFIICDELHSLPAFMQYSASPNYHTIAMMGLQSAVNNNRTKVIALTATPRKVIESFPNKFYELPIDQEELIQYDVSQIIPFTNINYLLSSVDASDVGVCYTTRISKMLEIEEAAKSHGLKPVCVWSISNIDHPMTESQLAARESILKDYTIPPEYNLLIINSASETSIKIKSAVDYVIINSADNDTQVQVRGRVNTDLQRLYLPSTKMEDIVVPDEFLNVRLFTEDKSRLVEYVNLKNPYNRQCKWPTVKDLLVDLEYSVAEGRANNLRYAVITPPQK